MLTLDQVKRLLSEHRVVSFDKYTVQGLVSMIEGKHSMPTTELREDEGKPTHEQLRNAPANEAVKVPRRRVVMSAKIEADSWRDLQHALHNLSTQIAVEGSLSRCSISGGYSTGHIIETNEDESITHDSWAAENDAYVQSLRDKPRTTE